MPASDGLLLRYFLSKRIPDTSQMALVGENRKAEDYPTEILTKALNITLTVVCTCHLPGWLEVFYNKIGATVGYMVI